MLNREVVVGLGLMQTTGNGRDSRVIAGIAGSFNVTYLMNIYC